MNSTQTAEFKRIWGKVILALKKDPLGASSVKLLQTTSDIVVQIHLSLRLAESHLQMANKEETRRKRGERITGLRKKSEGIHKRILLNPRSRHR